MTHILLLFAFSSIRRERDRERAQARNPKQKGSKGDGLTPEQRRERDAKALQEKEARKAQQGASGSSGQSKNKGNDKK